MRLDDPEIVRREYASDDGLRARASVCQGLAGPDARVATFDAVAASRPKRVLEMGCGWGEFAARIRDGLGADVVAVDISPRRQLVAATNGKRHLEELWQLVGRDKSAEARHFFSEDGAELLHQHFADVTRIDVEGPVTFRDTASVRGYVSSSIAHKHLAELVPGVDAPLVATRRATIFVAEKAS